MQDFDISAVELEEDNSLLEDIPEEETVTEIPDISEEFEIESLPSLESTTQGEVPQTDAIGNDLIAEIQIIQKNQELLVANGKALNSLLLCLMFAIGILLGFVLARAVWRKF